MPKVLYISRHNPWGIGGGAFASNMYLKALQEVFSNYIIDLCVTDDSFPKSSDELAENINLIRVMPRSNVSRCLSVITGVTHRFQSVALGLIGEKNYDYCVFDHSCIAGTLVKHLPKTTKSIVIHHNFEPDYFRDNTTSWLMRNLLLPHVKRCERNAYHNCDINLFLTQEDLSQFQQNYGTNCSCNLITGIFETKPIDIISATSDFHRPITIGITGSLDNIQNTDGILYFANELYPHIPNGVKIVVAGKNPSQILTNTLSELKNVSLYPNPKDMSKILKECSIFLCPARLGSGIKVRISDGLKAGLPVIAHSTSARGYDKFIEQGFFYSFKTPEEFSEKLSLIINRIERGDISSISVQESYMKNCSMQSVVDQIRSVL